MSAPAESFSGTERFRVVRHVGSGGMGSVYEALDTARNARVALKVLSRLSPKGLYLFKQEFRSLAGISHANLATLYELHSLPASGDAPEQWFFTMEYVDGIDFQSHLRGVPQTPTADDGSTATLLEKPLTSGTAEAGGTAGGPARPALLRPAFAQLVDAVAALHAAGKLHRDLKPSNVLVTREGRVVVLDFGLVADIREIAAGPSDGHISGTLAYMSPEQTRGDALTPASDWYTVGVMLYRALTGASPSAGRVSAILETEATNVPSGLAALCTALLRQDPAERPSGAKIRAAFASSQAAPAAASETSFVGREEYFTALDEMFAEAHQGRPAVVHVQGASGIGKSTLISEFLSRKASSPGVVVLQGRCHEQESIPYKTLDSLLDSLSRYLVSFPVEQSVTLVPRHAAALGQVFPVLRRLAAIDSAPSRGLNSLDIYEVRRLAFSALGELLGRLADRCRLILAIDDLQWGDLDGARQLMDILHSPDAPPLLLLLSYRSEHVTGNECLNEVQRASDNAAYAVRRLSVEPLQPEEARRLVRQVLGAGSPREESIVSEAGGNPYLLQELTQRAAEDLDASAGSTLDAVLARRAGNLPDDAHRLLELIAISGRPVAYADVCRASGLESQDPQLLALLRAGRFVRGAAAGRDEIEPYHDRIRETIVAGIPSGALRSCHLRLAEALESNPDADPEAIGVHFDRADAHEPAARYLRLAADRARSMLAFRHAAGLLKRALEHTADRQPDRREIELQLADTLAKAGFNAEAAELYERLTAGAAAGAFELRRRSAYCYAISGHIDEGKAAYRTILSSVGLRLPETPGAALRSVVTSRLKLWIRGTRFKPRDASVVAPNDLRRIDTAWSAATALTMVDLMAGASFTTRHLLLALEAGEPNRVVRALGWEAVVRGTTTEDRPQADRLLAEAERIGAPLEDPYTRGMLIACAGFNHSSHGRWRRALELFDEASDILRRHCPDANWELNTVRNFRLYALYSIGAWPQMAADAQLAMEDAHERGDLYSQALIGGSVQPLALMFADRPDEALSTAARALSLWTAEGFHMEHIQSARSTIHVKYYAGDYEGAWRDIEALWPVLEKNYALRSEWDRIGFTELRARCALALLGRDSGGADPWSARVPLDPLHDRSRQGRPRTWGSAPPNARGVLEPALRSLRKETNPYGMAMSRVCDANVALAAGDHAGAVALFEQSLDAFARMDCPPALAAGRRCFGAIVGGERGAVLIRDADEVMLRHGVANPARAARALAPSAAPDPVSASGGAV